MTQLVILFIILLLTVESLQVIQFFKTLNFFKVLPFQKGRDLSSSSSIMNKSTVLFPSAEYNFKWGALDDVVMGGQSKSSLTTTSNNELEWSADVTTANNGGFAGIRTQPFGTINASKSTGISMKCIGDGGRFKIIIRDSVEWNGVAWSYSFDTKANSEINIKVPFTNFIPTKFAKRVQVPAFDSSQFSAIQCTYSKFEYDDKLNPTFSEGKKNFIIKQISLY